MGVIVELRIPTHQFEFGRQFPVDSGDVADIERVGPVGDGTVPVFSFSVPIGDHPDSDVAEAFADTDGYRIELLEAFDDHALYVLECDRNVDPFFRLLDDYDGSVRRGTGTAESWLFETCFPSHDRLSAFRSACDDFDAHVEVVRVYNPTTPGTGAWFGLTPRQRRTLELAVERGYYDIPRRCTTIELADELGISDQAVTERLRRGIVTFVTNALLLDDA